MPAGLALPGRLTMGRLQPMTFHERGVAVPFTTPRLQGGRIRRDAKSPPGINRKELVIPNPGGGPGVYVLAWTSLPDICVPTLHDLRLWQALCEAPSVTPATLRDMAWDVLAAGYGGREPARAARAARDAEPAARTRVNFSLLLTLVRSTESAAEGQRPLRAETPAALEHRTRRAVTRVAQQLSWDSEGAAGALEEMTALLQPIGSLEDPRSAVLPRQLQRLQEAAADITAWAATSRTARDQGAACVLTSAADLAIRCASLQLSELRNSFSQPVEMLYRWREDAEALTNLARRPQWVLDGWPMLSALWLQSNDEDLLSLCWDLALAAPLLPNEVAQWTGLKADLGAPVRLRARMDRHVKGTDDRRALLVVRAERALEFLF